MLELPEFPLDDPSKLSLIIRKSRGFHFIEFLQIGIDLTLGNTGEDGRDISFQDQRIELS